MSATLDGHVYAPSTARTKAGKGLTKWSVLITVMVGTFMGPLDGSVVNIALPTLTRHFGVTVTTVEWVVVATSSSSAPCS